MRAIRRRARRAAVSGYSGEWLSLREPLDAVCRAPRIAEMLNRVRPDRPMHVTDLATGTGANLRYLSPLLGGRQTWCLVDHDQTLLDAIPARMSEWAIGSGVSVAHSRNELRIAGRHFECQAHCVNLDLAADLAAVRLPADSLVSGSALLDLVSESWLLTLAQRCLRAHAAVLFALTYDGRIRFDPPESEDDHVRELVNRHQMTDKGFGAALGPTAGPRVIEILQALGYRVQWERSDWHIRPSERNLQSVLIDGWLAAASEIAPAETPALEGWAGRRRAHVERGRSELDVGHVDLLGWIPS